MTTSGLTFRSHLTLIIANILFGVNFSLYVSVIKNYMNFETLFFVRVLFAALCFLPWVIFLPRYRIGWHNFVKILIPTVLVIYGHEFMMLWGAKYTNPVSSSAIATMAPMVTLIASSLLFHEKLHIAKIIGIALGISGAIILILHSGIPRNHSSEMGNLFMLISAIAAATNTVFIKKPLIRHGAFVVTGWYYIIGVLISAPFFAKQLMGFDFTTLPLMGWGEIVFILVLGTVLPNYLLYFGTEKLTSVHTGLYAYLQPLSATVVALLRGQVHLGEDSMIAAGLIFVGIILITATYLKFKFPAPQV